MLKLQNCLVFTAEDKYGAGQVVMRLSPMQLGLFWLIWLALDGYGSKAIDVWILAAKKRFLAKFKLLCRSLSPTITIRGLAIAKVKYRRNIPMTQQRIMPWIDLLPGGGSPDLQQRRESIGTLIRAAAEATYDANLLLRRAEELRVRARLDASALEGYVKGQFDADIVEKAKILAYPSR
ncbi:stable inheritance protein KleA [Pseudomonas helleri]|uniref:stable inheritance protein KleA n=1 Tax=Pseudomonas helleri TaxID=1608996 RepID=UPI003FD4ED8B